MDEPKELDAEEFGRRLQEAFERGQREEAARQESLSPEARRAMENWAKQHGLAAEPDYELFLWIGGGLLFVLLLGVLARR